jgi:hypothetical protein
MSEADDEALEDEADRLMACVMPEAYAAMMRKRAPLASTPAPKAVEPPRVVVALIDPESLKASGPAERMLANAAVLAHAAMVLSYQRGMAAHGALADAHLTQGARQALTVKALVDGLSKLPKQPSIRSSRETWNAYHRDLMRRRSALAKAGEAQRLDA